MWTLLILGHLSCFRSEVAGPHGFTEVFKMPGASFKLELEGPDLSFKDRAILREAGSGCPGRSHAADAEERRFSVSVATYVYHSQGSYEPSPLVHGGPIIAGANTPGWLKASWYPVQLRMPGSYRICYCAASDEGDFVRNSGLILGPNDSPCELDFASYRLVGVAYAMGIKHSEVPIGACLVSNDGTLQSGCEVHVRADRGGLSAEDMAELVSGQPSAICGEAPTGTMLQPLQGDAFAWRFQVPSGAETTTSYELESSEGLQRVLKVCYCEKQAIGGNQFQICSQGDWQNAGSLSLVGFEGSPADVKCYRGQRCRLGRPAFGMSKGDAAVAVPGNSSCTNLGSVSVGAAAPISILGGNTAVSYIDVEDYEGDLATICFCSASVHGIFGCQTGQSGSFNTLMGYVRSGGLEDGLRMDCVPTSSACPMTPTYLTGEDAAVAKRGKLFLAELKYRPCDDLRVEDVQQASLTLTNDEKVQVEMPWPILSGRYAICFCEDAIGCPQPNQASTLQHIGELRVLGAIDAVGLTTHPGFATIPLQVRVVEEATGIRCCAYDMGLMKDCVDLKASATNAGALLSSPGTFRFPLVLQEPLENYDKRLALNVSCGAMGEAGLCASDGSPGLEGFPCRQVQPLTVQLQLAPLSWHRPWRRPVGTALGTEAIAEAGGYATQLKAVSSDGEVSKGICKKSAEAHHFKGLPCQATECTDLDTARAAVPGHYELCVCEPGAVPMSQECRGWHHLGHLEVFGPFPLNSTLQGTSSEPLQITLQGISLTGDDSLVSVPLNSAPVNTQTVCVGEGRVLPAQSTVHSPADWSASYLRFDISLSEGLRAFCWLPPGSGMLPYYLGFAEIFGERINIDGCLVTPWQLLQGCSASKEIWYRRVLGVLDAKADCSVFEEERFCMKSPCPAVVENWVTNPMKPTQDEPMDLEIVGSNLSNDLHAVLVREDGEQQPASSKQGLCHYDSKVAGMAKCLANSASQQVCSFQEAPAGGGYQVCICMAEGPKCQAFLPALGSLQVEGLSEIEEGGGFLAAIIISTSLLGLCCPLLSPHLRRKLWQLWKRLKRKIFGAGSQVMAVPSQEKDEQVSEEEKDEMDDLEGDELQQKEEKIEKICSDHPIPAVEPEQEPSQCSTPRMENATAGAAFDEPLHPQIPEEVQPQSPEAEVDEVEGCKTPEELEEPVAPEKSRKELKRERKEERRRAREEKQRRKAEEESSLQLAPRPLPPPPLRAPPRKLPSLPVSPSFDVRSPAALEALAEATVILQATSTQKDGKLTDYGLSMKALSAALGRNDAELLAKALADAERAGVGRELLEKARQHLVELGGGPLPDASIPADAAKAAEDDVEQPAVEVLERADAAEARAPEPPADLGAVDTAEPAESEARVENSGDGDVGVAKDKTECQMDEILEDAPEATAPESEALSEAAAEEEDQVQSPSQSIELLEQEGNGEDTCGEASAAKAAEDDVEQPAVEVLERADAAEARAPEPPADLGAVDTAEPAESEARVENSGDGDVGVSKDKTECQMDEILEDAPEATAPESEALSEAAAEEEDTSKAAEDIEGKTSEEVLSEAQEDEEGREDEADIASKVGSASVCEKSGSTDADPGHEPAPTLEPSIELPFSPLTGAACSLDWQTISKEEPTIGRTGDVRYDVSPVHRQEQCVEWKVAGSVTVAERPPVTTSPADLIQSLAQEVDAEQHAEQRRPPGPPGPPGPPSRPRSALRRREAEERTQPASSFGTDELLSATRDRPDASGPRRISDPEPSQRQRMERQTSAGEDSLSFAHERMERQRSPQISGADPMASFGRTDRTDRLGDATFGSLSQRSQRHERIDLQSSSGMDPPSASVIGGVPKEKRKSTPIRPSLTGSTLVDGGTLMLWKSGDASGKTPPPPPPGGPPRGQSRPGSALGGPGSGAAAAQRGRAASKRSS